MTIKWPGGVYQAEADDLGEPIRNLLIELSVLEKPGEKATTFAGTPPSLQVISAGATTAAKGWAGLLAVFGGGGALVAGLNSIGVLPDPASGSTLERPAFMLATAIGLAAVAIAIALIVRADVHARAIASASQYAARAQIAQTMLTTIGLAAPVSPATTTSNFVALIDGDLRRIDRFGLENGDLVAYAGQKRVDVRKMRAIYDTNGVHA